MASLSDDNTLFFYILEFMDDLFTLFEIYFLDGINTTELILNDINQFIIGLDDGAIY